MAALQAGDREKALAAFREAWKYQQELSPEIRQQLKDKLFSLPQAAASPATRRRRTLAAGRSQFATAAGLSKAVSRNRRRRDSCRKNDHDRSERRARSA